MTYIGVKLTEIDIILIVACSMILAIGVTALIAVKYYRVVLKYYRKAMTFRTDEFAIYDRYSRKGGILFLGDSLTDFFRVEAYFPGLESYNRGIMSNTTEQVLARIGEAKSLQPSSVFLLIGVNDLIRMSKKKTSAEKVVDRIMQIAGSFPEADVYVSSLYPVNRMRVFGLSWIACLKATNKRIAEVNEILRARCEEKGYTYIDVYPHLLDAYGNLRKEYTREGLHLTAEGYCVVADVYRPYVDRAKERQEVAR